MLSDVLDKIEKVVACPQHNIYRGFNVLNDMKLGGDFYFP